MESHILCSHNFNLRAWLVTQYKLAWPPRVICGPRLQIRRRGQNLIKMKLIFYISQLRLHSFIINNEGAMVGIISSLRLFYFILFFLSMVRVSGPAYAHFDYSLPRSRRAQLRDSKKISLQRSSLDQKVAKFQTHDVWVYSSSLLPLELPLEVIISSHQMKTKPCKFNLFLEHFLFTTIRSMVRLIFPLNSVNLIFTNRVISSSSSSSVSLSPCLKLSQFSLQNW